MNVKVKIYETPKPNEREGKVLQHARVASKGTRRLDDICDQLVPMGLNTAQIKGILDGVSNYVGKSLREGYHIEVDGLGTFSLSVASRQVINDEDEKVTQIMVDGVNFRCGKELRKRIQETRLVIDKQEKKGLPLEKRKKQLLEYIRKNGHISGMEYTRLNDCNRYQMKKDMEIFQSEGIIRSVGSETRKVYVLKNDE